MSVAGESRFDLWLFDVDSGGMKVQPDWIKAVKLTTASKVHFKSDSPGAHARARRARRTPKEVVCEFTLCPVSADNEAVCGDQ